MCKTSKMSSFMYLAFLISMISSAINVLNNNNNNNNNNSNNNNNNVNVANSNLNQNNVNMATAGRRLKLHFEEAKTAPESAVQSKLSKTKLAALWRSRGKRATPKECGVVQELVLAAALLWSHDQVDYSLIGPYAQLMAKQSEVFH